MRIIAGEHRGRNLLPPATEATRPVTDRVKQSLFDILAPLIPNASVYDCFAGTGSMGLECLSRGASTATFFESDRSAAKLLQRNILALGVGDRCKLVAGDLFGWFEARPSDNARPAVDLVFLDPPYRFVRERPDDLKSLVARVAQSHLSAEGTIVFRHDANDRLELPAVAQTDTRTYGGMTIDFLRRMKP